MPCIDRLRQLIDEFSNHIPAMARPKEFVHTVIDMKDKDQAWSHEWSGAPGVYVFFSAEGIQYIGRALASTGLAQRVYVNSLEWDDNWNRYLANSTARVSVYSLINQDEIWVPSLEYFLIKNLRPPFNKRIG